MAVRIVIDSSSDIMPADAAAQGMVHIPMKILFDGVEYADAVTMTHEEFYEKLVESDVLPTTSQIPPAEFADVFAPIVEQGDTVVAVTISSKLSGTYQSAVLAAQEFPGRVFVVDSESVCVGERILIQRAVAMRDAGLSAWEIAEQLDREKKEIRVMALLDTLEYLKKGGRISAAAAMAGSLLSIKPVVAVENGTVSVVGKARGSRQGNNLLRELVKNSGGIDFSRPCCLGYSGLSDSLVRKYINDSTELWEGFVDELEVSTIGCAIGTHAGPGAVAVAFFAKA